MAMANTYLFGNNNRRDYQHTLRFEILDRNIDEGVIPLIPVNMNSGIAMVPSLPYANNAYEVRRKVKTPSSPPAVQKSIDNNYSFFLIVLLAFFIFFIILFIYLLMQTFSSSSSSIFGSYPSYSQRYKTRPRLLTHKASPLRSRHTLPPLSAVKEPSPIKSFALQRTLPPTTNFRTRSPRSSAVKDEGAFGSKNALVI